MDGVEHCLEAASVFRRRQPASAEEREFAEHVFEALCCLLLSRGNQGRFRAAEGFELMLRIVHENGFARFAALRTLAHALDGAGTRSCEAFVAAGGLKAVFPAFMGRGLAQTRREHGARAALQEEEYAVSAIASCLQALPPPAPGARGVPAPGAGLERLRLLAKFKEEAADAGGAGGGAGRLEKIDRLVELHVVLGERVERAAAAADEEEEEEEVDEEDEGAVAVAAERASERLYVRKLRGGLVALQKVDVVIAALVAGDDEALSLALRAKLYEQRGSLLRVREVLGELSERLDASASAEAAAEKEALAGLVDAVGRVAGHVGEDGEGEGEGEGSGGGGGGGGGGGKGEGRGTADA